ncbi:MAG: hypothetical protein KAV87_17000 [Desulfobacteraceae bacterium]|nr:hypothetical protein [Desulfobacteraceae bacterium]
MTNPPRWGLIGQPASLVPNEDGAGLGREVRLRRQPQDRGYCRLRHAPTKDRNH